MVYGSPISMFDHTWYKPAPMTIDELRFKAMNRIINMYDQAMDNDDYHLIGLFDNELGYMSQAAQIKEQSK